MTDYSTEEKIDYIFKELKNQKKGRIIKFILKLAILGVGIYFYVNFIQGLNKEELITDFSATIGEIVQPITENIINNIAKDNNIDINNLSPEMIEEINKNLK